MFFLIVNCLSACFDGSTALSVGCGCNIKPARGTGNFDLHFVRSGNRRKFTSMFRCASLAHPCASVAGWQTKFQVPLTALLHASACRRTGGISCQTLERLANLQKKNALVRTTAFCYPGKGTGSGRKSPAIRHMYFAATETERKDTRG